MATVRVLVVGAGGTGGANGRGGGGGGQVQENASYTLAPGTHTVTVGTKFNWPGNNEPAPVGAKSVFGTIEALGGRSGGDPAGGTDYADGGAFVTGTGGTGTNGTTSTILDGSTIYYGGGGGGAGTTNGGNGGQGGGGKGGYTGVGCIGGTDGLGGGGGGQNIGSSPAGEPRGGNGVVIIRYLTTDYGTCEGGTITTDGLYTVHKFTTSGTFTAVAPATGLKNIPLLGVG